MAKKSWQRKEKEDSKIFKSRPTPRSGGLWFAKGDSKNKTFLIDSKTSKYNRFSITKKMWKKINREALLTQKLPLLSVEFSDESIELVVMDKNDFISVIDNG
jgi:hypothetical protein